MRLSDQMLHLSQEAYDAEMYAMQLKHEGGSAREKEEVEAYAAKCRRDHRALHIRGMYENTGNPEPDVGEPMKRPWGEGRA